MIGAEVERLGRLLGALRSLNELESEDVERRARAARPGRRGRATPSTRAETGVRREGRDARRRPAPRRVVKGDRDRLLQVAANLLDNALKFTPEGGRVAWPSPSATARRRGAGAPAPGPAGAVGALTVADSGPGIDPVDLPFIFDRFYRSQAARGTQGVGLGLAIGRGLVEAQGGSVDAADAPGGGARFTVRLPAAGRV